MMRRTKIIVVFFVVLALSATNLCATPVTIAITAEVTWLSDDGGVLEGRINVGDIITGTYTYDLSTPDSYPYPDPIEGWYEHYAAPCGISLSVGGFVFETDPCNVDFLIHIINDAPAVIKHDRYRVLSENNLPLSNGVLVNYIEFVLHDSSFSALSSDALPTGAPVLGDWVDGGGLFVDGEWLPDFGFGAELTSFEIVPEPATTYYVDANAVGLNDGLSWEDAFNYLQDALAVAVSGDQIWVAEGFYKPDEDTDHPDGTGNREATFQLINGVALKGGYAGVDEPDPNVLDIEFYETILSGDLLGNDGPGEWENNGENSYHVVTGADNAVLDGFTITGGNADSSVGEASSGAGMICDGVSPTISNCTFRDNNAYWGGGGMLNHNNSSPILTNCTFSGNSAEEYSGGGVRNYESHPTFINCTFSGNESYYRGGGMQNYRSGPKLINCIFSENLSFLGGGVCNLLCSPTFINCVFSENSASYDGGGMRNHDYSDPVLINCTFFNNTASHCGGGMDNLSYSEARIINCIFWGNTDNDGVNMDESAQICDHGQISDVSYSCIQVLDDFDIEGKNNIGDDPCFVEPGYWDMNDIWVEGDYHLLVDSPCINTGDPNGDYTGQTDIDGDQRVINGRIDMGADEFRGPIYVDNDAPEDPGPNNPDISDSNENGSFAHPFDAIQEAIDVASNGETVVVLDGTYTGEGNRDIDFLGKAINVRSENGPENCIIDIGASQSDWHNGFYLHEGENEASIIEGFTIKGGFVYEGGAIYCQNASLTVKNCIITENTAGFGGGIACQNSNANIYNCLIAGNEGWDVAGGIYIRDSTTTITNCTVVENLSEGIVCRGAADIVNCIIWGNTYEQIAEWSGTALVSFSDVQGGWPGIGNIETNPCFVEPGYWVFDPRLWYPSIKPYWVDGDYHLLEGSPCIDAGDNWAVPADTTDLDGDGNTTEPIPWDLDGNPRIVDGNDDGNSVVDMGAYEFLPNTAPIADAGPNQVAYAWIDGIAEVVLDGNDSNDPDGDELTYLWSWTIGPTTYETNSVSPAIELPVSEHIIELIVNDGTEDSEPDEVTITVIEPMESHLWIFPRVINRRSRQRRILAWVRLPEGITRGQIDSNEPLLLYPDVPEANGIEAIRQYVFQNRRRRSQRTSILAFFDKAELMDAVGDNGSVELQVVGNLRTGQYFYGTDTVWITDWRRTRLRRVVSR